VASITNPLNQTVLFSHNAKGDPLSITNELGRVTALSYDAERGLPLSITDPIGTVTSTNSYDALGRISGVTNALGQTVTAVYDNDGRITAKKYGANSIATYGWNTKNQLISATDITGLKTFTRNVADQVTAISYPDQLSISLVYDDAGNVSSISYPGGPTVSYTYDSLNRTSGLTFSGNSISMGYNTSGGLASETRSNAVNSAYGYDAAGQLIALSHKNGATVIAELAYTRNDAGLIINESGTLPLVPGSSGQENTGSYNAANGVLTWGSDSYNYDADGNLTAIAGSKIFSATYDYEKRPSSITLGGITTTYSYDGLGNRVKAQASTTRNFHHDPWGKLLFETNASGQVTANYIYAGNRLVASGTGTTAGGYVFYHQDKTGNTLALTDTSGVVVAAYAYSPYGAVLNKSGVMTTPYTYVGVYGVMDEGNDLFYMKNRYYDAATGRFIQRDPIGFAGGQTNLYAYVGDNPVSGVDPEGMKKRCSDLLNPPNNMYAPPEIRSGTLDILASSPLDTPESADLRLLQMFTVFGNLYTKIPGSPFNSAISSGVALAEKDYTTAGVEFGKALLPPKAGFIADIISLVLPDPPVDENGRVIPQSGGGWQLEEKDPYQHLLR
jgi:RHS repeat-associated protein